MTAVLEVQNLSVAYAMPGGALQAVREVSLSVARGEVHGIMGESGFGKSTRAAAMINLLPSAARVGQGTLRLNGTDMLRLAPAAQRALRGRSVAMVFQDPMTAFNLVLIFGQQLTDFVGAHDASLARPDRLAAMLDRVGMPDGARCLGRFP